MRALLVFIVFLGSFNAFSRVGGDTVGGGGGGSSMVAERFSDSSNMTEILRYDSLRNNELERVSLSSNLLRALENKENGERIRLSNFREYLNENSTPSFSGGMEW